MLKKRTIYAFLLIILAVLSLIFATSADINLKTEVKVLVIHSFEESYEQYTVQNKLIQDQFLKSGYDPEIRTLYLNCERFREEEEIEVMDQMLEQSRLDGFIPDIILVNDDQAHYSLLKTNHDFVGEIPVVFAGVNYPNYELINQYPNVTGLEDRIDFNTNFDLISDFSPKDKYQVIFFIDDTFIDRKTKTLFLSTIDTARYEYVDSLCIRKNVNKHITQSKKSMLRALSFVHATLNEALWVMGSFNSDGYYIQIKHDYMSSMSGDMSQNMKFTAINEGFGFRKNFLAGYITTIDIQVREQVDIATRILKGTPVSDIPIVQSDKEYVADWFVLRKWGIGKEQIPQKYRIINEPYYYKHKIWLIIFITLISSLIVILFLYFIRKSIVATNKRRKAFIFLKRKNIELDRLNVRLEEQKNDLIIARSLAERAELKHSFITNMSHEIRTPLNAIVGFTNILLDEDSGASLTIDEKRNMVRQVNHNNELLLKLIDDVLDLSRLEAGSIAVNPVLCDLKLVVTDVFDTFKLMINKVEFRMVLPDDIDYRAEIDPQRLTQVLSNLLNNSRKFTSSGYIELGVEKDNDGQISVYVKDTGKGIEQKQLSMIFERFYKIDYYAQGTGIGLTISRAIMEKMGGAISVESQIGKGSCFKVSLKHALQDNIN